MSISPPPPLIIDLTAVPKLIKKIVVINPNITFLNKVNTVYTPNRDRKTLMDCLEGQCDRNRQSWDMEKIVQTIFEAFP